MSLVSFNALERHEHYASMVSRLNYSKVFCYINLKKYCLNTAYLISCFCFSSSSFFLLNKYFSYIYIFIGICNLANLIMLRNNICLWVLHSVIHNWWYFFASTSCSAGLLLSTQPQVLQKFHSLHNLIDTS